MNIQKFAYSGYADLKSLLMTQGIVEPKLCFAIIVPGVVATCGSFLVV